MRSSRSRRRWPRLRTRSTIRYRAPQCVRLLQNPVVSVVVQSGTFDNNGFNLPIGKGDMIIAAEAGSGEG